MINNYITVKKLDFYENLFQTKIIDFIKIDTEGFEYEVLCGAQKTIKNYRPKFIQIEFNWHQLFTNNSLIDFSKVIPVKLE